MSNVSLVSNSAIAVWRQVSAQYHYKSLIDGGNYKVQSHDSP